MRSRHIFWMMLILLQFPAWGEEYPGKLPGYSLPTGSCVDRCHVNYLAYHTMYRGKVFKHKSHSPALGMECSQCHNSDAVNTQTHGGLIIQRKACGDCHHKREDTSPEDSSSLKYDRRPNTPLRSTEEKDWKENITSLVEKGCLRCHIEVQEYMEGRMPSATSGKPDWMFGIVSCTDCHIQDTGDASFKPVRERCVECHNTDYGLLYDAWKETLNRKIKESDEGETGTQNRGRSMKLIQSYGIHNFRVSQTLLKRSMR